MTSANRSLIAKLAAAESWAATSDRSARTAPARHAFNKRFARLVDPQCVLPVAERELRAEAARRAHFLRLALRSAQVRRQRAAKKADA